jgi:G3E family GTPase
VDTHLAKGASFATSEIAGGCFCCKSDALIEAADKLTDEVRPDVFIAEPVGSCTDLIATVSLPLLTIYKREYELSPLAVLIDPFRASRVLEDRPHKSGGDDGASKGFSADVDYIYRKQLEEAEIVVINKVDVLAPDRLERIKELVHKRYPAAEVQAVSARSGKGLDEWFDMLLNRQLNVTRLMEVDYDRYGRGEAKLGWFNGTYSAESTNGEAFDGNKLLLDFATNVKGRFASFRTEVAHLKATLVTDGNGDDATILELCNGSQATACRN